MTKKLFTFVILPIAIIVLLWLNIKSIQGPIKFEKARSAQEVIAIERLKDIRTLQVCYKAEKGKFCPTFDELADFYNNDSITIVMQIGSMDDSLAVAQNKVIRDSIKIAVKDTLFKRPGFNIDSMRLVPNRGGKNFDMQAVVKKVSGVDVPLFQASVLFDDLLYGLDRQLIVNLNAERNDTGRFPGLQVGDINQPNNNAGNWE